MSGRSPMRLMAADRLRIRIAWRSKPASPPPGLSALRLVLERYCVEFEPVVDQAGSEPTPHLRFQALNFRGLQLDHLTGSQVDEMVESALAHLVLARPA